MEKKKKNFGHHNKRRRSKWEIEVIFWYLHLWEQEKVIFVKILFMNWQKR